jgi:molybdate transport system substrate-binding protein
LNTAKLTEPGTYYQYAKGKIVVWVPNDSKVDISSGLQSLLAPSVKKIAIANPQHAPYGQAAVAAMQKENVYDKVKDKLVQGENISPDSILCCFGFSRRRHSRSFARSVSQREGPSSVR